MTKIGAQSAVAQTGEWVGTPLLSSPSSLALPGSSKSHEAVPDRFIPRRARFPNGFSLFDHTSLTETADGPGNTGDVETET